MNVCDCVLSAMRAQMFLHIWYRHIATLSELKELGDLYSLTRSFISPVSFNIFNRLCDSLLLLVLAHAKYYPEHPFCPWLMGTEFIEHFFGIARSLLPNFTYAELLKMVKHTMLQQCLLLSGKFDVKKERDSRASYILDYDATLLTNKELSQARVTLTTLDINEIVALAYKEASAIYKVILHMPVPSLPLQLVPLSGPTAARQKPLVGMHNGKGDDEDDESDEDEWEGDDEGNEGPDPVDIGGETSAGCSTLCEPM